MKKNIFIKYTALSLLICMLATLSCTKDFQEINTDPVAYGPSSFDPNYTLTTAQMNYTGSTDFAYDTWRANLIYSATMMQGLSSVISYWAGDKYRLDENYTAAYWGNNAVGAYIEQVRFIVDVVEFTKGKSKYNNLHQVARLWKALVFARITDLYGDVPYTEAGKGYYSGFLTPKYDKQQAIYADLLKEVEEAANALDGAGDKITGDIIYNGNVDKWKRFGSTLLLRLAMRLVKIDENTAKTYAQKAVGKTMINNDDNAFVAHDISGGRVTQNRNSQVLNGDGGSEHYHVKWSKTFIDMLKSTNDPRLGKVAVTQLFLTESPKTQNAAFVTTPASQKGMPNGKDLSGIAGRDIRQDPSYTAFPDYSSPHPAMIKKNGVTFILTCAESEFLLAEAAQRWGIAGSAASHYSEGLKKAITFLGQYDADLAITEGTAEAYANSNPYNAANGLQMINNQYWLHTCTMLDFYETWSNWRRTGFPNLIPVVYPGNATNGTIPRRFPYPADEAAKNGANYREASAAVPGGDNLSGRVWWDKP
ncbi:SusD/RagB family nutrient-binding outer membrane lipoprotein [Pedobacter africanus]|uniref:Starch-binding associating with outer membrane n=1 Tax=Pedobacter africanus TaxID=151894 RepID=A0A1W2CZE9_9SPHI|nr:SusD/RagB family nutrient-binding outer membrane lipoprotein [Pedobacter africanus]SMC90563.1 Starch-binding associating with outer membrane [Pedobacter africanus]